jgi:hypothetical protein
MYSGFLVVAMGERKSTLDKKRERDRKMRVFLYFYLGFDCVW